MSNADNKMVVNVYLKSGAIIRIPCTKFDSKIGGANGNELISYTFDGLTSKAKPVYIRIDDVSAIVRNDEDVPE